MLVELSPNTPVRGLGLTGGLGVLSLKEELEKMFRRKVDLVRGEELNPYIRDDVLRSSVVICESSCEGGVGL